MAAEETPSTLTMENCLTEEVFKGSEALRSLELCSDQVLGLVGKVIEQLHELTKNNEEKREAINVLRSNVRRHRGEATPPEPVSSINLLHRRASVDSPGSANCRPLHSWSSFYNSGSDHAKLEKVLIDRSGNSLNLELSNEELQNGEQPWKCSLVGYFLGSRPAFRVIKDAIAISLKPLGSLELFTLPSGFLLFRFGCETDTRRCLEGGPLFIHNRLLILKPWTRDTKLEKVSSSSVPVWVKIFNLPLHLWTQKVFNHVLSSLGTPLCLDKLTASKERLSFARACVEISADAELKEELCIRLNGITDITVRFQYDWRPLSCTRCRVFGHSDKGCSSSGKRSALKWIPKDSSNALFLSKCAAAADSPQVKTAGPAVPAFVFPVRGSLSSNELAVLPPKTLQLNVDTVTGTMKVKSDKQKLHCSLKSM